MPTKAKLTRGQIKVMRIKLPAVAVWNGPALIRISLMHIQCGQMQRRTRVDRPLIIQVIPVP